MNEGLTQACVFGNLETIQYLIENGADVHVHENTPLMIAIDQGHLNVVQYLLNRGADANAQGGETILTSITALNNVEMLEAIVNAGGDIHVNNEEPLLLAVEQEDNELIEFLLTRGAVITDEIRQAAINTDNEEIMSSLGIVILQNL
jgi:ankyrin repeat protein